MVSPDSKFRELADKSAEGIVVHRHGKPLYANSAFARILGYETPSDVLAIESIFRHFVPENQARASDLHERRLQGANVGNAFEHPLVRLDGSLVWIESRISTIKWDDLEAVRVSIVDISDRHAIEQLKDDFISTVSHDLRTPLTSVSGALGVIAGGMAGPVSGEQRRLIDIAIANTDRLSRLIDDILDLRSLERGAESLRIEPLSAGVIIDEVLRINQPFLEHHNARVSTTDETTGVTFLGERETMVRVLTNLLSNAAIHAGGAPIEIAARCDGGSFIISVADSGPGVSSDVRPKLFERFAKGNESPVGGSGLGLFISRRLVEALGGYLGYTALPKGSKFSVRLPLSPVKQ